MQAQMNLSDDLADQPGSQTLVESGLKEGSMTEVKFKNGQSWSNSLVVPGDFSAATLDDYFVAVQSWLENDMEFLRKPIARWRRRSNWIRVLAFSSVALGVLLPLEIVELPANSDLPRVGGLELGYLAVLLA